MSEIHIVRHAESMQNAQQVQAESEFPYCTLNPLTEQGKEQAVKTGISLRRSLQNIPSSSILLFASPHLRTMQTAEIIRQQLNKGRAQEDHITSLTPDPLLIEQKWGILEPEYRNEAIIASLYEAYKGIWHDAASYMNQPILPEGAVTEDVRKIAQDVGLPEHEIRGESGIDVTRRLKSFLSDHQAELDNPDTHMIIVTSRGPVLMSRIALGRENPDELAGKITRRNIEVPNASITTYSRSGWKLDEWASREKAV